MIRILIALALLASLFSVVRAESVQEAVVTLFREVCVAPATPDSMLDAGERAASERKWKLDTGKSGRMPFMLMGQVDPSGAPLWVVNIWTGALASAEEASLSVWIVGPENPDVVHSLCSVDVSGEHVASTVGELEAQLRGELLRTRAPGQPEWFISRDGKTIESCGKTISISSYAPHTTTSLTFLDIKFPDTEKWRMLAAGFQRCDQRLRGN